MKNKYKFPCEECISLAICVSATKLRCHSLMEFLNSYYVTAKYPTWPELTERLCEVLRGHWCTVALNDNVYMIQRSRRIDDSFRWEDI